MYTEFGERIPRTLPKIDKNGGVNTNLKPVVPEDSASGEEMVPTMSKRESSLLSIGSRQLSGYLDTSQGISERDQSTGESERYLLTN